MVRELIKKWGYQTGIEDPMDYSMSHRPVWLSSWSSWPLCRYTHHAFPSISLLEDTWLFLGFVITDNFQENIHVICGRGGRGVANSRPTTKRTGQNKRAFHRWLQTPIIRLGKEYDSLQDHVQMVMASWSVSYGEGERKLQEERSGWKLGLLRGLCRSASGPLQFIPF